MVGNKKIEKDAILNKIISKENTLLDKANLRKDMDEIFKTGFFLNIEIEEKNEIIELQRQHFETKPKLIIFN